METPFGLRASLALDAPFRYAFGMAEDSARAEAKKAASQLRAIAGRLMKRSRELAEEARHLQERADDLDQIIRQRDVRNKK